MFKYDQRKDSRGEHHPLLVRWDQEHGWHAPKDESGEMDEYDEESESDETESEEESESEDEDET